MTNLRAGRSVKRGAWLLLAVTCFGAMTAGCGHSDEEMATKQREIDKLSKDLAASKALHDEDEKRSAALRAELDKLMGDLEKKGLATKELEKALAEYKQRADALAAIEKRYRDLRARLEKLAQVGIKFTVRNNRMVIQLPGDLLFDSGKDELKKGGKDVLGQVAEVIRGDKELGSRYFQVVGHTDNAKYPPNGPFKDNWGLSLARARQTLLFLIGPEQGKGKDVGGGLSPKLLSAAGYGDEDPIAGTVEKQTTDEMQKNRRVELVLQPTVDEMLNLGSVK